MESKDSSKYSKILSFPIISDLLARSSALLGRTDLAQERRILDWAELLSPTAHDVEFVKLGRVPRIHSGGFTGSAYGWL